MTTRKTFSLAFLMGLGLVVSMTAAAASPPTVTIEKAIHFLTPSGDDVLVEPGTYQVETLGESSIRLRTSGKEPLVVNAEVVKLTKAMEAPAVVIPDNKDPDAKYLVIKRPDGQALIATGSFTNVRSRGNPVCERCNCCQPSSLR